MPDTRRIMQTLRDELTLQTRHLALLEAQEMALLSCDRARFAQAQEEHALLAAALEAQDAARRAALTDDAGEPLSLARLKETAPEASLRGLAPLETSLRETLDRVQTLARRNRALIQNELTYFAFTLDLFVEAGRASAGGYGGGRTGLLMLDRRA